LGGKNQLRHNSPKQSEGDPNLSETPDQRSGTSDCLLARESDLVLAKRASRTQTNFRLVANPSLCRLFAIRLEEPLPPVGIGRIDRPERTPEAFSASLKAGAVSLLES
jgi:hypothetical protein